MSQISRNGNLGTENSLSQPPPVGEAFTGIFMLFTQED